MTTRNHQPSLGSARRLRRLTRASFLMGAAGLLLTMLFELTSVLGRHLHRPLLGSIELVSACVVIFASSALVMATLEDGHASVRMLAERLGPRAREVLQRTAALCSALFFGALALGSLIVVGDLYDGAETSELLQLPILPLRLFWCGSALLIVCLFASAAFARRSRSA
jgi:TRAP-type C4-dicarboxylate transport system permease small subunit